MLRGLRFLAPEVIASPTTFLSDVFMRSPFLPAAVLTVALVLGCADQQASPMAPADLPAPSFVDRTTQHLSLGFDTEQYMGVATALSRSMSS